MNGVHFPSQRAPPVDESASPSPGVGRTDPRPQSSFRDGTGIPEVLALATHVIEPGILPALDLTLPGSRRAEYRVPLTALERFERERTVVPREAGHGSAPDSIEALRAARARSNAAYHDAA